MDQKLLVMKKRMQKIYKVFLVLCLTLSFSFLIQKAEAQCTLYCLDTVRISLNATTCSREITPELVLHSIEKCPAPKRVDVLDLEGNILLGSPLIGKAVLGTVVHAKVTDMVSNNSCISVISVYDNTPPIMACVDLTVNSNVDLSPDRIGKVSVTDNCSDKLQVSHSDFYQNFPCGSPFAGMVLRTWTATDDFLNTSTCVQNIRLKWLPLTEVTFPNNFDGFEQSLVACNADTSAAALGVPLVGGLPLSNNVGLTPYYQDQFIPLCGGGFRLLRLWTVVDNCTNETRTDVQLIEGQDVVAPSLVCPPTLTISTSELDCLGATALVLPEVTDNCSSWTLEVSNSAGTLDASQKQLSKLSVGSTLVTYYAKDACQNVDSCVYEIIVKDQSAPTIVMDQKYYVFLEADGNAKLPISKIDQGTHDNCGVVSTLEVRRLATAKKAVSAWANTLTFDCDDLEVPMQLELRAVDNSGNEGTRVVEVVVLDNLAPTITCPVNLTVNCNALPIGTEVGGLPTVKDNCSATADFTDKVLLNGCGAGTIERTWVAKDKSSRNSTCTQYISVVVNSQLNINSTNANDPNDDVEWPVNISVEGCTNNILPSATGEPRIFYPLVYCGSISTSYEDVIYPSAAPSCFRIERKWTIIDRCLFQSSNYTKGKWDYTQEILVANKTAPTFAKCVDSTYFVKVANCGPAVIKLTGVATDDCTPAGLMRWSCNIDRNNDGSVDVKGYSNKVTAGFAVGQHRITWIAEDGCANVSTCSFVITIKDGMNPIANCKQDLKIQLEPSFGTGPLAILTPAMVDNQSSDNCTPAAQLNRYITQSKYSCDQMGEQIVTLHVADLEGNEDSCTTKVIVADDADWCSKYNQRDISGAILTESGAPVEAVTVNVTSMVPVLTTGTGSFLFDQLVAGNTYRVTPEKVQNVTNGVSTHDLVIMNKHILGLELINSPYKLIAADVNRDGKISTSDMVDLRKAILKLTDEFPNNTSWRFIDQKTTFLDPAKPFGQNLDGFIEFTNFNGQQKADFIGIKVGDLSGNAAPGMLQESADRSFDDAAIISAKTTKTLDNQNVAVDFNCNDRMIRGMQTCLTYDPMQYALSNIEVSAPTLSLSNFNTKVPGRIYISWNTDQKLTTDRLFTITLRSVDQVSSGTVFSVDESAMVSEYIDHEGQVFPLLIEWPSEKLAQGEQLLSQNVPNPFSTECSIATWVPESTKATLVIMDVQGKVLQSYAQNLEKGTHNWIIQKGALHAGVYFYKFETKFGSLIKKMIVID